MAFKMRNPFKQEKTSGFGPREKIKCPGDMIYHEPTDSCMTVDEYEDAMGKGKGSNKKVFKDGKNRVVINKDGETKVVQTNWQAHEFKK